MTSGTRVPTWRERENNKRRERRRRAIAAKIYAGLRTYGNYNLPKHCDNNEVLKALCNEAGWTVEPDGTTYRTGCKPPPSPTDVAGGAASPSPCCSYQPSPIASYNPSPASSSFPSPKSSPYITQPNSFPDVNNSLIPWLKTLSSSSASSSAASFPPLPHLYIPGGSISAPVTPPLSSPTARTPRMKTDWDERHAQPSWAGGANYTSVPNSTPSSPGRSVFPDPAWFAGFQISSAGPSSPTRSLVASNPFGLFKEAIVASAGVSRGASRMCTPGQSGTCSPVMPGAPSCADVLMPDIRVSDEFAFGSSSSDTNRMAGPVKAWEGERIHEECGSDDLELTLGNSSTRADA
ncbi:protein BZR1 homolog 3-like [Ananas comosus]|uniref:Protein BZR1 homolog n=1 Tax=Ananas comosus TaxID=4615 RepID=A0A6P5G5Q9_ANACO|nr:protein BZR1 homolog 3-like [Ananas comosus]